MKIGEGWIEFNGENRHAEYYICPKCKTLYNVVGDKVVNGKGELQLTFQPK
jgi:hypothetical protein